MLFDILTIFPELFASPLQEGILRRAIGSGRIQVNLHNIRDYAVDKHKMTDDRPFGGGEGMVMKPEPLVAALDDVRSSGEKGRVILLSPRGGTYSQKTAERFAGYDRLILVCGRYEGVDERVARCCIDEEISIGDYVLTGGELGAMVIIDSVTRLLPGVLGSEDSAANDTFSRGLLKHPQYTRPREFMGMDVPEVLLSGDHAEIEKYRFLESVRATLERRPELLAHVEFSAAELKLLRKAGMLDRIAPAGKNRG
ncbi:MAG TPA: tRNA (guanosine(37)-N1)-methyltransferase TrmD [Desulfobacteraceae bacterium]|nr:tRNA (guanosine(37)-N1)-methyltransferase TrmD [Desulfobacteraceae bacterium]